MSKERDAVVVVVVEEKQKRREEERRERRQQVSAWESRVKYLVLVKRRRKRTRRTRLQFTVNSSRVTGHGSQVTVHAQRAIVCATRAAPAVLGITVHGLTTNSRKREQKETCREQREREREPFISQQSSLINKFNTHTHTLSDQQQNDVSRLGE